MSIIFNANRDWMKAYEKKLKTIADIDRAVIAGVETSDAAKRSRIAVGDLFPKIPATARRPPPSEKAEDGTSFHLPKKDAGTGIPSICSGGELKKATHVPESLLQILKETADSAPRRGITYIQNDGSKDFQSYPDLLDDAQRILAGLRRAGLAPGDKDIFQIDDNRGYISCHWACIMGGFIQVPISIAPTYAERNLTVNKLINTWESLDRPLILSTLPLSASLDALAARENLAPFNVKSVEELIDNPPDGNWAEPAPDDLVIFLLTSGSTGMPKLVQQCHRSLIVRSIGTVELNGFTENEISLNWMPLDHVGGIVMCHIRDVYLSCSQIHAPTQSILENPLTWLDLIDEHRSTHTWAPNFAFGLINDRLAKDDHRHWDLSSMRSILNGGEAVVAKTARRFLSLLAPYGLPQDSMQPAWGMSETCSGVTHSFRFSLNTTTDEDQFVAVGEPIPGFSMRIVDEQNQIVDEGVIGHLHVHGVPVTSGYDNNPKANEAAFTRDGWFDTGDLGTIRDGQLTITGRGKGEIIINGVNYYSHEIESVVESVDGVEVSFTAATAVRGAHDDTDRLAIFFHPIASAWEDQLAVVKRIRQALVKAFGIYADFVLPVAKDDIPKTAIGKIQRSRMSKLFIEGAFEDLVNKCKDSSDQEPAVPSWFFRKIWLPASAASQPRLAAKEGCYLIFCDELGLGDEIAERLDKIRQRYIRVETGKSFARLDDRSYALCPDDQKDYDRLLASLEEKGLFIDSLLHLWGYSGYQAVDRPQAIQAAQARGVFSLLCLLRGLGNRRLFSERVRMLAVTSHAQDVDSDAPLAYEKGTLPGFFKSAALELPWLTGRHIDLEQTDEDARHLWAEIGSFDDETEIAYRRGTRMKGCLSAIDIRKEKPGALPLKEGGLYLITGGLGGIGGYLAKRLLEDFQARLILVGRTVLPDRSTWDDRRRDEGAIGERIRAFEELETVSSNTHGQFVYYPADISDASQSRKVLAAVQRKWDMPLSGIFHLAGDLHPSEHWKASDAHRIVHEHRDSFEAMFNAKVYGTWNLFQLLKENSGAVFVGFSSVVSELGGATFGAYCAANSFLNACSRFFHRDPNRKVFCFNWSMWEGLGMNKDNPPYAQQAAFGMGNMAIEPEKGWYSMLAGLCRKDPQVMIGLDGANPHIQAHLDKIPPWEGRLVVYLQPASGRILDHELQEQIRKALTGLDAPYELVALDRIPLLEDGSVDLIRLDPYGRHPAAADAAGGHPQTDAEKKIAAVWKEVLNTSNVRVDVNFFDCGGTSIQLAQVNGGLKKVFQQTLSMTDLFQYPTISSLAAYVTSSTPTESTDMLVRSKQRGGDRRNRMLRRRSAH